MASGSETRKRKSAGESAIFSQKWTELYFFTEINDRCICLICNEQVSVYKKYNLERHFMSRHKKYVDLKGSERLDMIASLKDNLEKRQTLFKIQESESVTRASYALCKKIAKKLKPHSEGEFVKECILTAVEILCPEKLRVFENISLSTITVSDHMKEMADDIQTNLKVNSAEFVFYSLAIDETTDLSDTAQMVIFIRGITAEFNIKEEFLALKSMHGITTSEELFQMVDSALKDFELPYKKLSGLATDDALSMVDPEKGLIALIKNEFKKFSLDSSTLIVCHCFIHMENLCAESLKMGNVMKVVTKAVNLIKSKGLNNRKFEDLMQDLQAEYGDLLYHCEVRWLSKAQMLNQFYELKEEVKIFLDQKGVHIEELEDKKFLSDLAFLVDITSHLNNLNLKLQGPNQLITSLLSHIKSFESMLHLFITQLKRNCFTHFPKLSEHSPESTKEYSDECESLLNKFQSRFEEIQSKRIELPIFETPFDVRPEEAPSSLQLELIELQSDNFQKWKYSNLPLLDFYKTIDPGKFPSLHKNALKCASQFSTTHQCEQFFTKLNFAKNCLRTRLTDESLANELRIAVSSM